MSANLLQRPDPASNPPLLPVEARFTGYRAFQAILAAHELSLFSALAEPLDARTLAREKGLEPHLCTLLCETLTAEGLLEKGNERYSLSPYSRTYLLPSSPFYQGNALAFLNQLSKLWSDLPAIIRNGPVVFEKEKLFCDLIIPSMADMSRCGLVQEVCSQVAALPEFSTAESLLDIGGGHGLYAIAFSILNPRLKAVIFDLPHVCNKAEDFIRAYQADRVTTLPGDFNHDDIGTGYDIIFSSSNPGGKDPSLIEKIAGAINPGGLYINKQVSDNCTEDPLLDLEWNLWTFDGVQKKGRYHFEHSVSLAAYNDTLCRSGFEIVEIKALDHSSTMVIARKWGG
jgi:hypothetical protein